MQKSIRLCPARWHSQTTHSHSCLLQTEAEGGPGPPSGGRDAPCGSCATRVETNRVGPEPDGQALGTHEARIWSQGWFQGTDDKLRAGPLATACLPLCGAEPPGRDRRAGHGSPLLQTKACICLSSQQAHLSVFCQVGVGWKGAKIKGNSCWVLTRSIHATPISAPYSPTTAATPGR